MMSYVPAILTRFGIAALITCAFLPAHAQSAADFYKGKSVAVAIAFSPGGGYDLYARTLARHMGKHIPGNPTLVPQNMPGAGGLRVAQYYSQAAPKDGLTFGTFTRMAGIAPLFDPTQTYDSIEADLARRHHRFDQRLRHLAHLAGEDLEGLP